MSASWRKKTRATGLEDIICELADVQDSGELLEPKAYPADTIVNLAAAAEVIEKAIQEKKPITIFGDYDADGVTASAILFLALNAIGATFSPIKLRLPRRMSEGYGISPKAVEEINSAASNGLLLLVDNGITAVDEIQKAREYGMTVVVLDHHLPREDHILPEADVIVDQHVEPGDGFTGYCGAGLAYKLTALLTERMADSSKKEKMQDLLPRLAAICAIGTICDMVPLMADNRVIVMEGIRQIRNGNMTDGLSILLQELEINTAEFTAASAGFYAGPAINACGRMYDDDAHNAMLPCRVLSVADASEPLRKKLEDLSIKINGINGTRKGIVRDTLSDVVVEGGRECPPLLVFSDSLPEGLCGIVAGKLAEEYGVSAYVFSKAEDREGNPCYKGSARIAATDNIKEKLDACKEQLLRYGGHAEAAGVTIALEKKASFIQAIRDQYHAYEPKNMDILEYDCEISPTQVERAYEILQRFQPFGTGCPEPLFCLKNCPVADVQFMPKRNPPMDQKHVRFSPDIAMDNDYSITAFNLAGRYRAIGEPMVMDLIGRISMKDDKFGRELQFSVMDMRPAKNEM